MKALILATAIAVGFASYGGAAEVKKDTKKAPAVSAKAMTDKEMDTVTAGSFMVVLPPASLPAAASGRAFSYNLFIGKQASGPSPSGVVFYSCFIATTQVLMADGSSRPISAVNIGDQVLGENGEVNRVVDIEKPVLGNRKLYAFNHGPAFVTPEHPFMTRAGWKSMSPEATFAENNRFLVSALEVGDELVKLEAVTTRTKPMSVAFRASAQASLVQVEIQTKFSPLESAVAQDGDPSMIVYNLRLDGNNTYFADNYLVHNK